MQDLIEINKFSQLHDGKTIIFCKTDFIIQEFKHIESLSNDVIFITGNSDYCITDEIVAIAPKNIKVWFCQNKLSNNPLLRPIPIGVENSIACSREGHGHVWPHAAEKHDVLSQEHNIKPSKLMYANFNINTNYHHRKLVKLTCEKSDIVTWQDPVLNYSNFVKDILDHEAVVCAQGNGPGDNHRIYETLYIGRIPITFEKKMYEKLHHNFPVIFIDNVEKLKNEEYIISELDRVKTSNYKTEMLDCQWWIEQIKNKVNEL